MGKKDQKGLVHRSPSSYKFNDYESLKAAIQEYNRNNPHDIIDNTSKYRRWCKSNDAPIVPKDTYKMDTFSFPDLLDTNLMGLEEFISFCNEQKITSAKDFKSRDRKSNPGVWRKKVPTVKFPDGFEWYMLEHFDGKIVGKKLKNGWAPIEETKEWFRNRFISQGLHLLDRVANYREIKVDGRPINIPGTPHNVYDDWSWEDITGNRSTVADSKISREEIAGLVMSYIDIIDQLDDMMIAILLSKISEKDNISKLVVKKVNKLITDIVTDNKPGERKEALEKLSQDIIDNNIDINDLEESDMVEVSSESDLIDIDDSNDFSYEDKLKKKIEVMEKAILNDDVDVDYRKLLQNNALKLILPKT